MNQVLIVLWLLGQVGTNEYHVTNEKNVSILWSTSLSLSILGPISQTLSRLCSMSQYVGILLPMSQSVNIL